MNNEDKKVLDAVHKMCIEINNNSIGFPSNIQDTTPLDNEYRKWIETYSSYYAIENGNIIINMNGADFDPYFYELLPILPMIKEEIVDGSEFGLYVDKHHIGSVKYEDTEYNHATTYRPKGSIPCSITFHKPPETVIIDIIRRDIDV